MEAATYLRAQSDAQKSIFGKGNHKLTPFQEIKLSFLRANFHK